LLLLVAYTVADNDRGTGFNPFFIYIYFSHMTNTHIQMTIVLLACSIRKLLHGLG